MGKKKSQSLIKPKLKLGLPATLKQFIAIAEIMNECLWVGDENFKTIYVNPVFEETTGYSLKECIGKPGDFCFSEKSKNLIKKQHSLRKKGVTSQYEGVIISKHKKKIPVMISGAPTKTGGSIGLFINLTKVKQLADDQKITQEILQHSSEAIIVLNKKRKIQTWSKGAQKMFGYKESEVLNKHIIDLIIPEKEKKTHLDFIKKTEKNIHIRNLETRRKTKKNKIINVLLSVTRVVSENKSLIGYLAIYRDITQQKVTQSELQKRFEAIQDAYKELGLQRRHLDYLFDISTNTISKTSTLENLENLTLTAISLLTKCDGATLRILNKNSKTLILKSAFGVNSKWTNKHKIKFKNSIAEEAFKNKRPIVLENININTKHQGVTLITDHGFTSLICVPLYIERLFLGSITLYAKNPQCFRLIETDFLERISRHCAVSLFAKSQIKKL